MTNTTIIPANYDPKTATHTEVLDLYRVWRAAGDERMNAGNWRSSQDAAANHVAQLSELQDVANLLAASTALYGHERNMVEAMLEQGHVVEDIARVERYQARKGWC